MFKTKLTPRWTKVLTGVAICTLMCIWATTESWAAMCMVGLDEDSCKAATVNAQAGQAVDPNGDGTFNCIEQGYTQKGAKKDTNLWPKTKLKVGTNSRYENNTAEWRCLACDYTKNGYKYYKCSRKCQYTIGEFGEGVNPEEDDNHANPETDADKYMSSQAECTAKYGTTSVAYGEGQHLISPNRKYRGAKKSPDICGVCEDYACDGDIIGPDECVECEQFYVLDNGSYCCMKDKSHPMDPAYQPFTPVPNDDGRCFIPDEGSRITGYGQAKEYSDPYTQTDGYCYLERTCNSCQKFKGTCVCQDKDCDDYAEQAGAEIANREVDAREGMVIERSSTAAFKGKDGICLVPTEYINSDCNHLPACYKLTKLSCPTIPGTCECDSGCPSGTLPEAQYLASNYVNPRLVENPNRTDKLWCLQYNEDGECPADKLTKCYAYDSCSDFGSFLTPGGDGCVCAGEWKEAAGGCDYLEPKETVTSENSNPIDGYTSEYYKPHDPDANPTYTTCHKYDGVKCEGVLAAGPDESTCECMCTADYSDSSKQRVVEGYDDWTAQSNDIECMITNTRTTRTKSWKSKEGGNMTAKCHRADQVSCPDGTTRSSSCECECLDEPGMAPEDTDDMGYTQEVDEYYTNQDGESVHIACYSSYSKSCTGGMFIKDADGNKKCVKTCQALYDTAKDHKDAHGNDIVIHTSDECNCWEDFDTSGVTYYGENSGTMSCPACVNRSDTCSSSDYTTPTHDNCYDSTMSESGECVDFNETGDARCKKTYSCSCVKTEARKECGQYAKGEGKLLAKYEGYSCLGTGAEAKMHQCELGELGCKMYTFCSSIGTPEFTGQADCPTGYTYKKGSIWETGWCLKDNKLCGWAADITLDSCLDADLNKNLYVE